MRSVPAEAIHWDHKLAAVIAAGDGRHRAVFGNGRTVTCDVLVGVDGAWSRVRPLVSPARPAYTGISFVETILVDGDGRHGGGRGQSRPVLRRGSLP